MLGPVIYGILGLLCLYLGAMLMLQVIKWREEDKAFREHAQKSHKEKPHD